LILFGNPKPYQKYLLESSLLSIDNPVVETDIDGFAHTRARYSGATPATVNSAKLFVTGATGSYSQANSLNSKATIDYEIIKTESFDDSVFVQPTKGFNTANGTDVLYIDGKVSSKNKSVENIYVYYRVARTVLEAFAIPTYNSVLTDENGFFRIGPITVQSIQNPGYWFMVIETSYSPSISSNPITISGDITHWYEDSIDVILNAARRVILNQERYEADDFIEFRSTPSFKVNYITGNPEKMSATPNVTLPKWFKIPRYTQYQMGLLGNEYYYFDNNKQIYPS